jgi:hypothetical protein
MIFEKKQENSFNMCGHFEVSNKLLKIANMPQAHDWLAFYLMHTAAAYGIPAAYRIIRPKIIESAHWLVKYDEVNMFFTCLL